MSFKYLDLQYKYTSDYSAINTCSQCPLKELRETLV